MLVIGTDGEIVNYRILAKGLEDESICRAALDRILGKENPGAATPGQDKTVDTYKDNA